MVCFAKIDDLRLSREVTHSFGSCATRIMAHTQCAPHHAYPILYNSHLHVYLSLFVVYTVELNKAQHAPERRIEAVTNACEVLDHGDSDRHDIELAYGAAAALSKLLAVCCNDDEIRMILAATEMVFRGSPKAVTQAFSKCGTVLLSNLLKHLDRFETRSLKHAGVSILNISKVLHSCSRSSELRATLLRQNGMLAALSRVSTRVLSPESRLMRIRIIANVSNCEENKILLFEQPEMLESILRIGHFDNSDLARQYAGITLMEFSSAPANQVALARNDTVLGTLVKMILVEKSSMTRESAITALQNLAFTKENRSKTGTIQKGHCTGSAQKRHCRLTPTPRHDGDQPVHSPI